MRNYSQIVYSSLYMKYPYENIKLSPRSHKIDGNHLKILHDST